jgi:hypothetical protein
MSSNGTRRVVSLAELEKCEQGYSGVRRGLLKSKAWVKDWLSLKLAIEHAKGGRVVYVQEDLADGPVTYLLSDEGADGERDEHKATVCANALAAWEGEGGQHEVIT